MARRFALRGRCSLAVTALTLAVTASGCGGDDFSLPDWDAPGQNARIGSIMIRYAHLAEPRGEPWKPGDEVPAYVWLYNKGSEPDKLVGASTTAAASVDIVGPDGKPMPDGVNLPANKLVELEPGSAHLVLRDVRRQVRGGDFIKITMRFQDAGSITFNIQSQIPVYDQSPSPNQGYSSPSRVMTTLTSSSRSVNASAARSSGTRLLIIRSSQV